MERSEFKKRMQSLKSYREQNPGKGYWDWKVELSKENGEQEYSKIASDNTRVNKPVIIENINRKLKPTEFFITNTKTGKRELIKLKSQNIEADTRDIWQKQEDQKKTKQIAEQYEEYKKQQEGIRNLQGFLTSISPSTYIGPIFNNNGKTYLENMMSGQGMGNAIGNTAIDAFTALVIGRARNLITNAAKKLHSSKFKSELNWSPKSWFEEAAGRTDYTRSDIDALTSHVPEYHKIERLAKEDGTWLKMPDGSTWKGDPRSWVQLQSKNGQKLKPEIIASGVRVVPDPEYNEMAWGVRGPLNTYHARHYTNTDNNVLQLVIPKDALSFQYDAKNRSWFDLPYKGKNVSTNEIVDDQIAQGKNIIYIDNVQDLGSFDIPMNSKYQIFDNKVDYMLNRSTLSQNDVTIAPHVPRKSILGNNGNFDFLNSNIYRVVVPIIGGHSIAEEYKNGGIHIKPENRGKFTRLKERTGKSATWFKQHGTPEQKKMATFALNAKKWKHADGGEIPPELYERSDYQGSNDPVYVNPFTGKPLATGAITPVFNLEDFVNFTPAGDVLSVRDAFIAAKNRDLIGLGLAGLGVLPYIPTVNRNHFAERFAEMEKRDAKKHELLDDFFKQRNEVYEDLIENEEAYRRAANADRLSNSKYRDTYSEMIRQYGKGNTDPNLIQPATDRALYATSTKAQVDPQNLDYIFLNPRYADPDELETAFQRMNPGLIRHEMGHIVDEKAGLDYTNSLSNPNKFVSDEQLKLMFPKSHKRLRNEILNRGSEIKSYMNEFRDFLMNKHEYNDRETVNGMRKKLDRYNKQFPVLNKIYDSYKSKKQFVKDYNSVPLTATESNKTIV